MGDALQDRMPIEEGNQCTEDADRKAKMQKTQLFVRKGPHLMEENLFGNIRKFFAYDLQSTSC